jgi:hypothetical protein
MRIFVVVLVSTLLLSSKVFAQFPTPYCSTNFSAGILAITHVSIGTISNASPVTPNGGALQDFTTISTALTAGSSYQLTVQGQTGGQPDNYRAFFDWNRDGDFDDFGEQYYISPISSSTGSDGVSSSTNILVPFGINPGITRMRIIKNTEIISGPCTTTGRGQAEDYSISLLFPPPKVVHVKEGASGLNNGTSWRNAYQRLEEAMAAARARDTIKIAAGRYTPGTVSEQSITPAEGMVILGGVPACWRYQRHRKKFCCSSNHC